MHRLKEKKKYYCNPVSIKGEGALYNFGIQRDVDHSHI